MELFGRTWTVTIEPMKVHSSAPCVSISTLGQASPPFTGFFVTCKSVSNPYELYLWIFNLDQLAELNEIQKPSATQCACLCLICWPPPHVLSQASHWVHSEVCQHRNFESRAAKTINWRERCILIVYCILQNVIKKLEKSWMMLKVERWKLALSNFYTKFP